MIRTCALWGVVLGAAAGVGEAVAFGGAVRATVSLPMLLGWSALGVSVNAFAGAAAGALVGAGVRGLRPAAHVPGVPYARAAAVVIAGYCCAGVGYLVACPGGPGFAPPVYAPSHAAPAPAAHPHIIFIAIDTLRADHMSVYGYGRPTTPFLEQFAREAIVFDNAFATAPWTRASVASYFTALYPAEHGAAQELSPVRPDARTLAELLRDAGYATVAVVANASVTAALGDLQGFTEIHETRTRDVHPPGALAMHFTVGRALGAAVGWTPPSPVPYPPAALVRDVVAERLARGFDRPTFLYIHFMDPHYPYAAPAPCRGRWSAGYAGPVESLSRELWAAMRSDGLAAAGVAPRDVAYLAARYDEEIACTDAVVGEIVRAVDAQFADDPLRYIITSDHGEEFGDHGGVSHGHTLHRELLRVPLLMHGWTADAGVRRSDAVGLVDILPTVAAHLGLPAPAGVRGRSLFSSADGGAAGGERLVYGALDTWGSWRGVRTGRWAYLWKWPLTTPDDPRFARLLFDVRADPGERTPVAAHYPEVAARLDAALAAQVEELRAQPGASPAAPISPDRAEQLRALGYLR